MCTECIQNPELPRQPQKRKKLSTYYKATIIKVVFSMDRSKNRVTEAKWSSNYTKMSMLSFVGNKSHYEVPWYWG